MRRLWVVLWLAVVGWDALSPHIMAPAPRLAALVLLVGGALLFTLEPCSAPRITSGLSLGVAAAGAAAAALVPWPERLGFLLVAAGSVVGAFPFLGWRVRSRLWQTAAGLGGLIVVVAATSHLYAVLEGGLYRLGFLARPLALLYRALGVRAVGDPPFVHVQGVGGVASVDTAVGRVVGEPLALFVVAGFLAWLVVREQRHRWRWLLLFLVCAVGFAAVRFMAMGLALNDVPGPTIYWARGWAFGALLALAGLLAAALPFRPWDGTERGAAAPEAEPPPVGWSSLVRGRGAGALVAAAAFGALAAAFIGFHDPGVPKPGRVLVDERHSNWAWSTVELNTESYGTQTVYNYSEMLRYLKHFYDVQVDFAALSDSLLSNTDVLILKAPTRPYDDAEVEAVVRFVERGGGLWLVGDHTNIFGMSTNLNRVAGRFGLRYRYDAVVDLTTGGRQLYDRPRVFCHPSITELPTLLLATSCSIEAPPLARRIMLGRSLLSDELDYSVNTFFGNFEPDPHEPFGSMLQAAAVTRGRGRVLAFTDSTIFSNFFIFIRGKRELALGSVAWLMRGNELPWSHPALLGAAAIAGVAWIVAARRLRREAVLASICVGTFPAFAIVAAALAAWVGGWSALPQPKTPLLEAAFMRERCAFHIPEKDNLPDESPHSFHTFYVWTQRVGFFPRTDHLLDCVADSDVTIIVNPRGEFAEEALRQVEGYVRAGGGLLVLDRPYATDSTANAVLERFGLRFEHAEIDSVEATDVATGEPLILRRVGTVVGGEPVVSLKDGRSVAARANVGDGRVVALLGADNFSDASLGTTSQVPNANQLKLYRLEYRLLAELLPRPTSEEE